MLEAVVEQHHVGPQALCLGTATSAVRIDNHRHSGEAPRHLERLVSDLCGGLSRIRSNNHHLAVVEALIAASQHRRPPAHADEVACQGDHRWGLAGATKGQIADRDHRHSKPRTSHPAAAIGSSPDSHRTAVDGGQRQQQITPGHNHTRYTSSTRAETVREVAPRFRSTTSRPALPAAMAKSGSSSHAATATRSSALSATSRAPPASVISS